MCSTKIGAETLPVEESAQTQNVDDVYIGVFFDEAGHNMVQKYVESEQCDADTSGYAMELKNLTNGVVDGTDYGSEIPGQNSLAYIYRPKDLYEYEHPDKSYLDACNRLAEIRQIIVSKKDDLQIHPDITPKNLCDMEGKTISNNGLTNVSLLYSLFNGCSNNSSCSCTEKIYVEGVDSKDLYTSCSYPLTDSFYKLKDKTVISQVSKALCYVSDYVTNSIESGIITSGKTELHFFIFGSGLGSVSARLLSNVLVRDYYSEPSLFEHALKQYSSNTLKSLITLYKLKLKNNITIDYLGLFDTICAVFDDAAINDTVKDFCDNQLQNLVISTLTGDALLGAALVAMGIVSLPASIITACIAGILSICAEKYKDKIEEAKAQELKAAYEKKMKVEMSGLYLGENERIKKKVKKVFHLGAIDEYRKHYAFINLGYDSRDDDVALVPSNTFEVMIPGSHQDVGGSYMDGTEIIRLNKKGEYGTPFNMLTCAPNVDPKDCNDDYSIFGIVCIDTFKALGWLDENSVTAVTRFCPSEAQKRRGMKENTISNYAESDNLFRISRYVKGGYSDIPLAMMLDYCGDEVSFQDVPDMHNYIQRGDDLKKFGDKMKEEMGKIEPGKRYWFIPADNYYKELRLNYLHFSALDDVTGESINTPYYDLNNHFMCRPSYDATDINNNILISNLYDNKGEVIIINKE